MEINSKSSLQTGTRDLQWFKHHNHALTTRPLRASTDNFHGLLYHISHSVIQNSFALKPVAWGEMLYQL